MKNKRHLKIGMDYHGVINSNPDYFKALSQELSYRGHEVHVITGGPCHEVSRVLKELGFCYTRLFAILDHYEGTRQVQYDKQGRFHVDDELWNSAKAKYCSSQGIDLHIDDSLVYLQYFTTPYCCYDIENKQCLLRGSPCLDFTLSPTQIVNKLEKNFLK